MSALWMGAPPGTRRYDDRLVLIPSLRVLSLHDAIEFLVALEKPVICMSSQLLGLVAVAFWMPSATNPGHPFRERDLGLPKSVDTLIRVKSRERPESDTLMVSAPAVREWFRNYRIIGVSFAIRDDDVHGLTLEFSDWGSSDFALLVRDGGVT